MATKKILTDIDVQGATTTDSINVGTATGGVAGSQTTSKSTSTSTGTSVNTWIDVNRAHTATASGATYASVERVVSNSSFLDGGIVGSNQVGRQSGTGGAEYIYGNQLTGEQTGSGPVDFIIGTSVSANSSGNAASTVDYVRGVSIDAMQNNANGTVNFLQGTHVSANLTAGTVGEVNVELLDFDYTAGTITGDLSYIRIQNDDTSMVAGTARAIHSISTLPSLMAGDMETTAFIKTGGTSSQYLMADGSVSTGDAAGVTSLVEDTTDGYEGIKISDGTTATVTVGLELDDIDTNVNPGAIEIVGVDEDDKNVKVPKSQFFAYSEQFVGYINADGSATSFAITHDLGYHTIIQVVDIETASDTFRETVFPKVVRTSATVVTVSFNTAPVSTAQYYVYMTKINNRNI